MTNQALVNVACTAVICSSSIAVSLCGRLQDCVPQLTVTPEHSNLHSSELRPDCSCNVSIVGRRHLSMFEFLPVFVA